MLCGEVVDIQNIELLIQKIEKATHVSIDTETKSLEDKTLVAYSICCDGDAYFIPVAMKNLQNIPSLPQTRIMQALLNRELIYHNYAFDAQVLTKAGFPPTKLPHDTLIIAHLLNENTSHRLKDLVKTHLNYQMTTYKELCGTGKKQISFAELDGERATYYGVDDALYTYKLFMYLHNKLIQYDDLRKAYYDIERPLMLVVQDMHTQGVPVDVEKVKAIQKVCTEKMQDAYDRLQYYMKGINLNSPIQLRDYFIGKRHQPILKRSPRTGEPSVDSEVLEKYANTCKEAGLILEYRYYAKILTTFIPALTPTLDNGGMKIYPEFSQAGTKSGRFSSSNPNGQNFPKSKDELGLRSCFKAPDGYKLIVYDYSGIEMRLVAALSNETKLIDAFNKDLDIHSEVAKDVGCARHEAKVLSYALLYGAGVRLIAKQLNCSLPDAQQYIYNYYNKYPQIRHYLTATRYKAHKQGYLSIYGGRRRNISTNFEHKSDYEKGAELRSLVNATIQGASATLLKKAMIQIHQQLQPLNAHLIMTVHDELMAIATTENAETVAQIMKEEMIAAGKEFAVKISVDGGIGNEWSSIH